MQDLNRRFLQAMAVPNPYGAPGPQLPNMLVGFPGSQGPFGQFINTIVAQIMAQLAGPNMIQMPFQRQNINMQSIMAAMGQVRLRQGAMMAGAEADEQAIVEIIRGLHTMFELPFGEQQEQAAQLVARDISRAFIPLLAQTPDGRAILGQMFGQRGSAALAGMDIAEAARMQIGPGGRIGLTGTEVRELTTRLYEELFAPGRDLTRMSGLRMHEATGALLEMTRLGMGPQGGLQPGNIQNIQRFLEDRAPVVRAVQDIFAEMGQANPSPTEIFNALETLTQGAWRHMSSEQVVRQVRNMHNIARTTGQTVWQFVENMQIAQQMGDRLGLDRSFAPQAVQHAALVTHAAAAEGRLGRHFGGLSREQFQARIMQMTQTAAASPLGQRMAMITYLGEGGGLTGEAASLAEAIRLGRATFGAQNRNVAEVVSDTAEMMRILEEGGASRERVMSIMASGREFLQEYAQRYNVGALAQAQGQRLDVDRLTTRTFGNIAAAVLRGRGESGQQMQARANEIGVAATQLMRGLRDEERADPARGIRAIAAGLRQRFQNLSEREAMRIAEQGWMTSEGLSQRRFGANLRTMQQLTDPRTAAAAARMREQITTISRTQQELAGLGAATPIERISNLIQEQAATGRPMQLGEFAARLVGYVPTEQVRERLQNLQARLEGERARVADILRDPEANREQLEQFREEVRSILGDMSSLIAPQPTPGAAAEVRGGGEATTVTSANAIREQVANVNREIRAAANNAVGIDEAAQPADVRIPETTRGPDQGTGTGTQRIQGTLRVEWPPTLARFTGGLSGSDPRAAG